MVSEKHLVHGKLPDDKLRSVQFVHNNQVYSLCQSYLHPNLWLIVKKPVDAT